jgi:hypothetical protein
VRHVAVHDSLAPGGTTTTGQRATPIRLVETLPRKAAFERAAAARADDDQLGVLLVGEVREAVRPEPATTRAIGAATELRPSSGRPRPGVLLAASVLAAVHHAEVVAHRVGEPFGALILAVAVTVIEGG